MPNIKTVDIKSQRLARELAAKRGSTLQDRVEFVRLIVDEAKRRSAALSNLAELDGEEIARDIAEDAERTKARPPHP